MKSKIKLLVAIASLLPAASFAGDKYPAPLPKYAIEVEACIMEDDCEYHRPATFMSLKECMAAAPSFDEGVNTPTVACVNLDYERRAYKVIKER